MPNNPPKNDTPDKALVPLHSCPPGLFRFGEVLGFKTEYGMTVCDENGAEMPGHLVRFKISNYPDAYVLESGETFWGGAKSHAERSELLVEPVNLATLSQPQHGGLVEALKERLRSGGPDRDEWTAAGMADAFFRWPVIERELHAALASNSPGVSDATKRMEKTLGAKFVVRNSPVVGEDAPYAQHHDLGERFRGCENVAKPTPTDTADSFREDNGDKDRENPVEAPTDTADCNICGGSGEVGGDYGLTPSHCQCRYGNPTYADTADHISDAPKMGAADRREAVARIVADYQQRNGIADEDAWNDGWGIADALIAASLIAVPDGMVLVPREPSMEMLQAGSLAAGGFGTPLTRTKKAYRAMIAAATGEA